MSEAIKALVLLAHGSRVEETEATMAAITAMVKERLPGTIVEECFMQFRDKDIHRTLTDLAGRGVTEIAVVPYFLFSGMHILQDIPEEIEKFREGHPDVAVQIGKPLGADPRLAEILVERALSLSAT